MLAALLLSVLPVADEAGTISVNGSGTVDRTADRLVMATTISATGKLAGDAITKQQSFREQFDETIGTLGIPGLQVRSEGTTISTSAVSPQQRQMMQQRGQEIPTSGVSIAESILVEFAAPGSDEETLQTVRQLLDAASDLDVEFQAKGQNRLLQPIVADPEELKREAYEKALADARSQADHLASLVGRKIAGVKTITVSGGSASRSNAAGSVGSMSPYQLMMYFQSFEETGEVSDAPAQSLTTHSETARLSVVFLLD